MQKDLHVLREAAHFFSHFFFGSFFFLHAPGLVQAQPFCLWHRCWHLNVKTALRHGGDEGGVGEGSGGEGAGGEGGGGEGDGGGGKGDGGGGEGDGGGGEGDGGGGEGDMHPLHSRTSWSCS